MENDSYQAKKTLRLKYVIIVLAVLLAISIVGLSTSYIYRALAVSSHTTETIPNNLIGKNADLDFSSLSVSGVEKANNPNRKIAGDSVGTTAAGTAVPAESTGSQASVLELYQKHPEDNQKFAVDNMLPGDSVTKYFCIKTYHDADIALFFNTKVTEETKSLSDVLHIRVTCLDTGEILCDAPFAQVREQEFTQMLAGNATGESIVYYQIDVSLDTSVGNDYQAALLKADFNWYVKDDGSLTPYPPKTGETINIVLWAVLAASSLLMIVFLMRRRKEDKQNERAG